MKPARPDRRTTRTPARLRLRTLISIRWAAVLGQSAAILLVHYGLDYTLPLIACAAAIGASILLNVVLTLRGHLGRPLPDYHAVLYLGYDILQLAALLYLTGGLNNPFALLVLAPVIVSATALSRPATIGLGGLAVAVITVLAFYHQPLPWPRPGFELPEYYMLGVWQALVIGILFTAAWVGSVSEESRAVGDALVETQVALSRAQRLSELGALAAAAAHELGSPLATIAVVAKEMARDVPKDSPLAADVALLIEQSDRCREILAQLSQQPEQRRDFEPGRYMPLGQFLDFVAEPYRAEGKPIVISATAMDGDDGEEPEIERVPEVIHALGTLIQNATQFAKDGVRIQAGWDLETISIEIVDDGPGFPPLLLDRLGEPYVSTRKDEGGHMGLGLFIAQTLLGRYGARLAFANRREGGARVTVDWDRATAEGKTKGA
ncbi:MAG: ActS/PrrB/RegB family redox-sensitive histidine kinase [Rhodospirillaceae bacterium]|nr:ActS/PrrB/RegB family redox-sensitive histidine kinase [Rhodospirillaceae bacterium]